jgi:hypothetical protein
MAALRSIRSYQPGHVDAKCKIRGIPHFGFSRWLATFLSVASSMACSASADPLQDYAQECDRAIGVTVPEFDCDAGTEVPGNNPTGLRDGAPTCDQPNRLNEECDPGSKFQVLTPSTNSAYVVAHCRKEAQFGSGPGEFRDIAVIQHNKKNGATCFYQAGPQRDSSPAMSGKVRPPSEGEGKWSSLASATSRWRTPSSTLAAGCVSCHDNGPLIRSPYINGVAGKDAIPGKDDTKFNRDPQPYYFVGKDFVSWKAFKVEVSGNTCNDCHRMGVNNVGTGGTARDFGLRATSECSASNPLDCEKQKNFHGPTSPIWMKPGQTVFNPATSTSAHIISECAQRWQESPLPDNSQCRITQFAGPYLSDAVTVVNGATQSPIISNQGEGGGDLSACSPGGSCPLGFCYFGTLHGPFWQTSPSTIPTGDAAYRGSFIRIFAEDGKWKYNWCSPDPSNHTCAISAPPVPPPGGTMFCTAYNEIVTVPDPTNCFERSFTVFDPDGTHFSQSVDATATGSTVNVLSGLVGNVAQSNIEQDKLQVTENGAGVTLMQSHREHDPLSHQLGPKLGPLRGESWTNGCRAWKPNYLAANVFSTSDVQLVSPAQSDTARCFITGIAGAWSSTRNDGATQPFAEIYKGPTNDLRLRVSPDTQADRTGAFASCIQVK